RPCHGRERNGGGQAQGGGEGVDGEEHLEELVHGCPSLVPAASAPAAAWCRAVLPAAHWPARWRSRVKRAGAETKRITSPWTTVIRSAGMRAKSCMERPPACKAPKRRAAGTTPQGRFRARIATAMPVKAYPEEKWVMKRWSTPRT